KLGHSVVGQASTAAEAIELFHETEPDLVLMDIRLDGADGIELTTQLLQSRRCPVIIVSAYSDPELTQRAAAAAVFGYLLKPATADSRRAQIDVAVQRFAADETLQARNQELQQAMEARKLVERAKGIFMKRMGMSEPDAYRRLQTESQNRRM